MVKTGFDEITHFRIIQVVVKVIVFHLFLGGPKNWFSPPPEIEAMMISLAYWSRPPQIFIRCYYLLFLGIFVFATPDPAYWAHSPDKIGPRPIISLMKPLILYCYCMEPIPAIFLLQISSTI